MNKQTKIVAGIFISVLALALIVRGIEWGRLRYVLGRANYWWLLPFLLVETASIWARGMRWRVLLQSKLPPGRMFWIVNVGYFISNVLPLRIGEAARVYLVTRKSDVGGIQALSTAVLERMIDLLMVFALVFAVLPWVPEQVDVPAIGTNLAVVVFCALIGLFIAANRRENVVALAAAVLTWLHPALVVAVTKRIASVLGIVHVVKGRLLLSSLAWTCASWILSSAAVYLLLLGFVPSARWYVGVVTTCVLALGLAIPAAPSGVGIWEGAMILALGWFGISPETALGFALVMHMTIFIKMAALGLIGLAMEGENLREIGGSVNRFTRMLASKSTQIN